MKGLQTARLISMIAVSLFSCKKEKLENRIEASGYPYEVGEIIITRCAISGCHNDESRDGAAGLSLENWDKCLQGGRGGAVVIPYRPDFSTLIYYINTYSDLGEIQLTPVMPLNGEKLTHEEVKTLSDWVANGAQRSDGDIDFQNQWGISKIYVANQGCDMVSVVDGSSGLIKRYISVGKDPAIESPHMIRVTPDKKYWCVSFIGSPVFQVFRVADNSLAGQVEIGMGSWNTFIFSSDAKFAYVVDFAASGKIAIIDLTDMTAEVWSLPLVFPHGSAINPANDTLYVTGQIGNFISKIPLNDPSEIQTITVDESPDPVFSPLFDIHEIIFTPDYQKYFVTCQRTNEVRAFRRSDDSLLAVIPVGQYPQEMAVSNSRPYLFVSCSEDSITFPGKRGSIYVIDYNNFSIVKSLYTGHQPHGIAVDEDNHKVYITNRNVAEGGPAPHHAPACSGRNGYITTIDLNALNLIPGYKTEVSVDPYGVGIYSK